MLYKILSIGWNADPDSPDVSIRLDGNALILEFYLNCFLHPQFKETKKCKLIFQSCQKYYYNESNVESFKDLQARFKPNVLPPGEFYELDANPKRDFPSNAVVLSETKEEDLLKHFIFLFKDATFECLAYGYKLSLLQINS